MSEESGNELLSPEEADRLLQRASELDSSRSVAISVEQLRQSAIDAGIDAAAFDAALRESRLARSVILEPMARRAPMATPRSLWQKMSAVGLSLGVITQLVRPVARIDGLQLDRIGAATILLSVFAYLLLRHGRGNRHRLFQGDLASLFTAFMVGSVIGNGGAESAGPWVAIVSIAAWLWAGTGVLGAGLIHLLSGPRHSDVVAGRPRLGSASEGEPHQDEARPQEGPRGDSNRLEVRRGVEIVPA